MDADTVPVLLSSQVRSSSEESRISSEAAVSTSSIFEPGGTISGKLDDGAGGRDWLDYAAINVPVRVNLTTDTATDLGGGVVNIRNVRLSQGGNSLRLCWRCSILVHDHLGGLDDRLHLVARLKVERLG